MRALVVLLAAFTSSLSAQREWWASPTGNDATGDGTQARPFRTVSRCLTAAAASGDTIRLTAGTFGDQEQIHVTGKSVTLRGAGIGQTILRPHATLFFTLPGGTPPGTPQDHAVAVVVDGRVRVDLYDLTLDNAHRVPPTTGRSYNVMYLRGADGTIEGCELVGARHEPLAASEAPAAVMVRGDGTPDPCRVTVRRCRIADFGKAGVLALYDAEVLLEDNDVTGAGAISAPALAQVGLHVGAGAGGSILRNRVRDLELTTSAGVAAGIRLLDAAPGVLVEGNRVLRCELGIEAVRSSGPQARPLTVRENTVTECDVGIHIDHDGATVMRNTLHRARTAEGRDDTGTATSNVWADNNWEHWSGSGSLPVAGSSGLSDATPRRGIDQLSAQAPVALGAMPVDVVAGAFGGARLDFATVDQPASAAASPTLSVALQTGPLTFTVTALPFAGAGAQPAALAGGQFDGQPGLDLAAVTDEGWFYVFANDGNGAFSLLHSGALPAAGAMPHDLAAGDVDGDGLDDLVVASLGALGAPGAGIVLRNGGGGTSWTATLLPGTFTGQCKGVALAQVDAGASLDVVLTEGTASSGVVHIYANDGSGGFAPLSGSPFPVGADPTSCAVDDVDHDGDADLLVTCSEIAMPLAPGTVHVLRQDSGGFTARVHRVGRLPAAVLALDLGGDSDDVRRDVAFVSLADYAIGLLAGHGADGFTANLAGLAGTAPRALAAGDFDGDGADDLVVADAAGPSAVVLLASPTARADVFGTGCPGEGGRRPRAAPWGAPALPRLAHAGFGVQLDQARPFAVAVLLAATQPPSTPAPCTVLLAQLDLTWIAFTDAHGRAHVRLPVPAGPPALAGLRLWLQWAVLDPQGGIDGFLATSDGLRLRVGG